MKKKWSRKYPFEWLRYPLSPINQTWQVPVTADNLLLFIREKLGFYVPIQPYRIINGYFYITANYARILARPQVFTLIWKIVIGVQRAKEKWKKHAFLHEQEIEKLKKISLQKLTERELYELTESAFRKDAEYIAWELYSGIYSHGLEYVFAWLFPLFIKQSKRFDYRELLKGFDNKSLQADRGLWSLAQLKQDANVKEKLTAWLNAYGHKIEDFDVVHSSLQEQPDVAISMLNQFKSMENPAVSLRRRRVQREKTQKIVTNSVRWWIPFGKTMFKKLLSLTQSYVSIREDRPFYVQGQALARKAILELGLRMKKQDYLGTMGGVFFLTKKEIQSFCHKKIIFKKSVLEKRKKQYDEQKNMIPPSEIIEPFDGTFPKKKKQTERELVGKSGSTGEVTGSVKVIHSQKEFDKFKKGEILVTQATSPAWTPLLNMAAGVVTDLGGMLCHAAIVSRELGIPAVVGTEKATTVLKDGDKVTVDGEKGLVTVEQN